MNLEDENFALKFELDALANLTVFDNAERWVPGFMWRGIDIEHHSRYELAYEYVEGKKVLDVACGSGYGSFLLAEKGKAREVLGLDVSENAVRYGNIRYPHSNVRRLVQDVRQFNSPNSIDAVVSFETIEHLNDYESFLQNIRESLTEDGILVISTPIVNKTRTKCDNPHHVIEWSFLDFQQLIGDYFSIEKTFIQSIQMQKRRKTKVENFFSKVVGALQTPQPAKEPDRLPVLFMGQFDIQEIQYGYQILVGVKK